MEKLFEAERDGVAAEVFCFSISVRHNEDAARLKKPVQKII